MSRHLSYACSKTHLRVARSIYIRSGSCVCVSRKTLFYVRSATIYFSLLHADTPDSRTSDGGTCQGRLVSAPEWLAPFLLSPSESSISRTLSKPCPFTLFSRERKYNKIGSGFMKIIAGRVDPPRQTSRGYVQGVWKRCTHPVTVFRNYSYNHRTTTRSVDKVTVRLLSVMKVKGHIRECEGSPE